MNAARKQNEGGTIWLDEGEMLRARQVGCESDRFGAVRRGMPACSTEPLRLDGVLAGNRRSAFSSRDKDSGSNLVSVGQSNGPRACP